CVIAAICGTAAVLITVGIVVPLLLPAVVNGQLDKMFVLSPNSPTIESFIEPSVPFQQAFYFFNVTNADEILIGKKPRVEEVGPFFYEEKFQRQDINWNVMKSSVSYRKNSTFRFVPDKSAGLSEDTLITTVNPIMLTLAAMVVNMALPTAARALLEIYLWRFQMEPFITKPAGELLFDGYEEPIIRALYTFTKNPNHKTGRFGFYYPKNQTKGVVLELDTGAKNISNLMKLLSFDGRSSMDVWSKDSCNEMRGSFASPFPRPIFPEKNIVMFSPSLCRSVYFEYNSSVSMGKLELYRYKLPFELMGKTKENECYCSDDFTCRDSMADIAPCRNGVPIVASYPHFYMASKKDINAVVGLKPEREKHETYLDVDPVTGLSLKAKKRVQINMPLKRYADLPALSKVQELIFPILWMDQGIEAPDASLLLLYEKVYYPQVVVSAVCYVFIALGVILIIAVVVVVLYTSRKRKKIVKPVANGEEHKDIVELQKPFIE
ncbi:CD36 family, partial [Trinorchestia longiramus]